MRTLQLAAFAALLVRSVEVSACPGAAEAPQFKLPSIGAIKDGFGYRLHPLLNEQRLHTGVDFASPMGTPVAAASAGRVAEAGRRGQYGNYIRIGHGAGYATTYAHLNALDVREGDCVVAGSPLGISGCTGLCSEPHLHFEVLKDGVFTDPQLVLPAGSR